MVRKNYNQKKKKTNADCEFEMIFIAELLTRLVLGGSQAGRQAQLLSVFLCRLLFHLLLYYAASVVSPLLLMLFFILLACCDLFLTSTLE